MQGLSITIMGVDLMMMLLLLASSVTSKQAPTGPQAHFRPPNGTDGAPMYWMSNNAHLLGTAYNNATSSLPSGGAAGPTRSRTGRSLSDDDHQAGVDKHNYYRSGQGSSDMLFMYHSEVLATRAQTRADTCVYKHLSTSGSGTDWGDIGENLYMSTAQHTLAWAIRNWVEGERWYYDYDTKTCQTGEQCGHYTQCVWADTQYVGCGYAACSPLYSEDGTTVMVSTGYYTVCSYGAIGNYNGQDPFQIGDACTECGTGQYQCFDQLCRDCTTDGCLEYQYDCQATCENCGVVSDTCTCDCPAEFRGDHCQTLRSGEVDPGNDCPTATPQPPEPPCGGVYCFNDGTKLELSDTVCFCSCPAGWQGDFCEYNQDQQENGALVTIYGESAQYSDLWFVVGPVLIDLVNIVCRKEQYYDSCCNNHTTYAGPYTSEVVAATGSVLTGDGYPRDFEGSVMDFLVYAKPSPDNDLCGVGGDYYIPAAVMIAAIQEDQARIENQLLGCCLFVLVESDWLLRAEVVTNPYLEDNSGGGGGGGGDNGSALALAASFYTVLALMLSAVMILPAMSPSELV